MTPEVQDLSLQGPQALHQSNVDVSDHQVGERLEDGEVKGHVPEVPYAGSGGYHEVVQLVHEREEVSQVLRGVARVGGAGLDRELQSLPDTVDLCGTQLEQLLVEEYSVTTFEHKGGERARDVDYVVVVHVQEVQELLAHGYAVVRVDQLLQVVLQLSLAHRDVLGVKVPRDQLLGEQLPGETELLVQLEVQGVELGVALVHEPVVGLSNHVNLVLHVWRGLLQYLAAPDNHVPDPQVLSVGVPRYRGEILAPGYSAGRRHRRLE